jgi:hypothetical protein
MLCPCGAVWSVQSWFRRKGNLPDNHGRECPLRGFAPNPQNPVYISPWALRLLFIQMCLIYFFNGFYKLLGPHWRAGDLLQYVVGNIQWSRWSFAMLPVPFPLIQASVGQHASTSQFHTVAGRSPPFGPSRRPAHWLVFLLHVVPVPAFGSLGTLE